MQARASMLGFGTMLAIGSGCASNPEYLPSPMNLEAGMAMVTEAKSSLVLPIKPESTQDAADRAALATKLGLTPADIPYVKAGDIEIEVEWSIRNLDAVDGQAKIELNGANEWFVYDPTLIILNPADDEAPPTPGLSGNIPINVPASGEVQGVFREDQLLEASIDCDAVTRGHVNPFAATLMVDKNDASFAQLSMPTPSSPTCLANPMDPTCLPTPTGLVVPRAAFANLIRVDLVFRPDHHMVLDYTVRVRDHRNIVHDMGLSAPTAEVVAFAPMPYAP
ncbi:MAG: hypothetical protein JWO36_1034 [Myxococcales bacterium]|nr:hypothetical protein [Myxococcales bacterium]